MQDHKMTKAIQGLLEEMRRCEAGKAYGAAAAMGFIIIDTLAFLSMPANQSKQYKEDFFEWVNRYLKADESSPYQYNGLDVYAARCALLHAYGSEAEFHRQDPTIKQFGYHNGTGHRFNPEESESLVLIGIISFEVDLGNALIRFKEAMKTDEELRKRVAARLPNISRTLPISSLIGSNI